MNRVLKKTLVYLGIAAALITAYFIVYMVDARKEIQEYCSQITEGMSVEDAKKLAGKQYLQFASPAPANADGVFTAHVRGFGYSSIYYCEVDHDGRSVIKARMH